MQGSDEQKIAALPEALKYGEAGLNLVLQLLDKGSFNLNQTICELLKDNKDSKVQKRLHTWSQQFYLEQINQGVEHWNRWRSESFNQSIKPNLKSANFSYANLSNADLTDAFLHRVNFQGANLQGANLFRANLFQANLQNADLRGANLIGADLSGADLSGADLTGAKVGFGEKIMVKLTSVNFKGATMPNGVVYS